MANALKFLEELNGPTTIGMLIRAYRTRNDLTLEAIADALGVTKSYVSDLEHDRKTISLKQAREIAEKLGDSVQLYAKVWMERHLREADMGGVFEIKPIAHSQIKAKFEVPAFLKRENHKVAAKKATGVIQRGNLRATKKAAKKKVS